MATTEAALQVQSSQEVLRVLKLSLMPNNVEAGPGRTPPPTVLLPFLVQRFSMHDGHFDFLDDQDAGRDLVDVYVAHSRSHGCFRALWS
jgi:hypothetical protein